MDANPEPVLLEEQSDSAEAFNAVVRREQFDRNSAWFQAHASEVFSNHRGKCICIVGEELFVAETAGAAMALAKATHPDDRGWFVHYIAKDKLPRIYTV